MHQALTLSMLFAAASVAGADEPKDRFQWLEDVTGDKALRWVKDRNAASTAELTKGSAFAALDERLLKILDSKDRIPAIVKHGPWYYNFWRDDKNKRGLWRRTLLEEYRKEQPKWEIVLDLDALSDKEKENWVWAGVEFLRPKNERCVVMLSRGGADAHVAREFDVITKDFVKDGFVLPEAKSEISWRNADVLYVSTDFGPDSLTKSGYPRITKAWQRGTKLADAKEVFAGKPDDVSAAAFWDLTPGYEREFALRNKTFYTNEMFVRRNGKFVKIDTPDHATVHVVREWLYIVPRKQWKLGDNTYRSGSLLAVPFEAYLKGERTLDVLFEPTDRKSLDGFSPTRHHVLLSELDNVANRLYVLTHANGKWQRQALPDVAPFSSVKVGAVDADESDKYFLTVSGFLTPSTLYLGTVGAKATDKLKTTPALFDAARPGGDPA